MIRADIEPAMHNQNASVFTRVPFDVENPSRLTELQLGMKYNDGFVAYINGQEVARRNAPVAPQWDSTAEAARSVEDSLQYELIDISDSLGVLQPGRRDHGGRFRVQGGE